MLQPMTLSPNPAPETFLGIEGGGTRTLALLADCSGLVLSRVEAGPANIMQLTDLDLKNHFRSLAASLPRPSAVAIGLAGAWISSDFARIRAAASVVWPRVPCHATNDLETTLAAASKRFEGAAPRVLIVSGTGSCCYGKTPGGQASK